MNLSFPSVVALALCLTACGGASPQGEASSRQSIVGGYVTYQYPEFGELILNGGQCSGTLIGPRTVLTAAHCVGYRNQGSRAFAGTFSIFNGNGNPTTYSVIRFWSRINVNSNSSLGQYDLAVLQLDQAVPSSVAVPHLIGTAYPLAGRQMAIFGFGSTSPTGTSGSGVKRRTNFVWEVSGERGFDYIYDRTGEGDSGGAVVADKYIIGVVSGSQQNPPYQDYFGNVAQEHAWVALWRNYFETYH